MDTATWLNRSLEDEYESALGRAIACWRKGRAIPFDLATELMEEGYDVPSLENHYMKG